MNVAVVFFLSLVSTFAFALPKDGESYFIKSIEQNQYVYDQGGGLGLGSEDQKTTFTLEKNGDNFYIKLSNGQYVSAAQRTGSDVDSRGKVTLQPHGQEWEKFIFVKTGTKGIYFIRSRQWNTYLRANIPQNIVDQTDVAQSWEKFEFIKTDNSVAEKRKRDAAATRLQSLVRGAQVRKETVMPSELAAYFEKNLKGFTIPQLKLPQLSRALARAILDQKNLSPEGKRLYEAGKEYSFSIHDEKGNFVGTEKFTLPMGLWLTPIANGGIEIEMIGQKVGQGAYKQIFQSRVLVVDLQTEAHEKKIDETVLVQGHPSTLLRGQEAIKEAFTQKELEDPELRLAGILTLTGRISPKGSVEARDVEFRGDLDRLSEEKQLTFADQILILADVATTLRKLHAKGFTHGDVKPKNILVSKGTPRGFLTDFDFLQRSGNYNIGATEGYQDSISKDRKLQTPFTDIFALAMSAYGIFDLLFPNTGLKAKDAENRLILKGKIREVQEANLHTARYVLKDKEIQYQLTSQDQHERQAAIAELNRLFPAFQKFLDFIIELPQERS